MRQLVQTLTHQLVVNGVIKQEETEIYNYGFMLILTSGTTTLTILLIGVVLHKLVLTVLFLLALMSLRHYAGGFHARSYWQCFVISCTVYLGALGSMMNLSEYIPEGVMIFVSCVFSIYLWKVGSLNSKKQPKTTDEMRIRKRRTRVMTTLFTIGILVLCMIKQCVTPYAWLLFYVQAMTVLGIILVKVKKEA